MTRCRKLGKRVSSTLSWPHRPFSSHLVLDACNELVSLIIGLECFDATAVLCTPATVFVTILLVSSDLLFHLIKESLLNARLFTSNVFNWCAARLHESFSLIDLRSRRMHNLEHWLSELHRVMERIHEWHCVGQILLTPRYYCSTRSEVKRTWLAHKHGRSKSGTHLKSLCLS